VGKTGREVQRQAFWGKHPHVRGEDRRYRDDS